MESNLLVISEEALLSKRKRHTDYERIRRRNMSLEDKNKIKMSMVNWAQKVNITKIGCKQSLQCENALVGNSRYCLNHWFDRCYVRKPNRFKVTVSELTALWNKQSGRCAITNLILVPGKNVALDHIVPQNKNGTNTIENLRFIHYNINLLKHSLSDIELKSILSEIGPSLLAWAQEN